ncbi:MAG: cyclodeaminase/cyclohydrolase family protein [Armatimonadota bacterium]|nr:cyclodeaminase/cyclohydrolase family protein [Armatimonadota bacterium]MDR7533984.1 cyclodeaminase/cyclohydrolase family protein [Armatimonadota bacterium]MDR7536452.1 cyclodeaminase/cyclohydrolase family protein [Armatimonadota bacterium]
MYPELSIEQFLDRLASSAPEPGGGAAAALVGAVAAALVGMVANLTVGKEKFAAVEDEMRRVRDDAATLRARLLAAIDRDADAFRRVMAAYRLPRETDEQRAARREATRAALREAAEVPAEVVALCGQVGALSRIAAAQGNPQVLSDAAVAAVMAEAAAASAALNVRINLAGIGGAWSDELWAEVQAQLAALEAARAAVVQQAYGRIG